MYMLIQKTDFMKDIEITSTALYYVVEKIKPEVIEGYVNNVQLIDSSDYLLKLKIHKQKTKEIIIGSKFPFISEHSLPVNSSPDGLIKFLKKKLYNQRIQEFTQDKNNRVIYLKLDDYFLIFELFSNSNIILTDLEFTIITSKQKEEWKDRIIKKNEKYIFPQNKDIKEKTIKELEEETNEFDIKKTISYLVKEYNVSPIYLQTDNKTDAIKLAKKIYNYKFPLIDIEETENKKTIIVKENKSDIALNEFFKQINEHYIENIKIDNVKEETTKTKKQNSILESQLQTKKEYQEIADKLQKEGEAIYSYFQTIEKVNEQIRIARDKKIPEDEIIKKLNDYFSKNQNQLKITKINLKDKTYTLDIQE